MTATIPESVKAKGRVRLDFLPSIADLDGPTVAEFTAGTYIGRHLMPGWQGPTGNQESETDGRFGFTDDFERAGITSWVLAELTYTYDPQGDLDPEADAVRQALTEGLTGFASLRYGPEAETAIAGTQKVDLYPIECGVQNKPTAGESASSPLVIVQRLFVTGPRIADAVIAA